MGILLFPYLMGEGKSKGFVGGTETLNRYSFGDSNFMCFLDFVCTLLRFQCWGSVVLPSHSPSPPRRASSLGNAFERCGAGRESPEALGSADFSQGNNITNTV